ncbi:MAG: sulfatase-like hydrolase/transferase, partial [Candidatus Aminicenantes bacterium]|nr:sulfatase-like hydrolase/transferase [Candidatus Aminicenantes bacterium]
FYDIDNEIDFYRVNIKDIQPDHTRFRVDKKIGKLYFKRKDKDIFLEHIPSINGIYFYLKGTKSIRIKPEIYGDIGLYTYVEFHSLIKRVPIRFVLEKKGVDESQRLFKAEFGRMSRPLFNRVNLKKGDTFQLLFQGTGIVYFSKPIIYRRRDKQHRKNIFLIGVDTLRGDHIGMNVGGQSLTPHIDQFVKDGVCFKNAYAQSSWTIPSFISLFSGLYEFNHNVDIRHPLTLDKPHLVENLSEKYITFGLHGGCGLDGRWGYYRGFDFYQRLVSTGPLFPEGGKSLFNRAMAFLKESQFPRFFFFLHTYQVHSPYTPPRDFLFRINKTPRHFGLTAISHGNLSEKYLPVDDELRHSLMELYQAEVLAFDTYFGHFIQELKKENLYENALIILMSDHGEEFFEHKGWEHCHSLYDELIKVPLIIKFPGGEHKDTRISNPVGIIDIMPTILGYCQIEYNKEKIDGVDSMPLIRGEGKLRRDFLISSLSTSRYLLAIPPKLAFIFDNYKLIYNYPFSEKDLEFFKNEGLPPEYLKIELYNLGQDLSEINNIAELNKDKVKKFLPIIMDLKKRINKILSARLKTPHKLDKEVIKKLETLGYL